MSLALAHLRPADNLVDKAVLEKEFRCLETRGQSLLGRVRITRAPANPIRAPGSAMMISPRVAKLAVTPPMVGWVSTEMKGMPGGASLPSAALVFAICIRE